MPKLGMEPIRKAALIKAAIQEIGRAGTLDVTVSHIARQAGMSSALAHHYFGGKEDMFLAAMRHILTLYGQEVRKALAPVRNPQERLQAIVEASFATFNFRREVISAWLNFYVLAQTNIKVRRLLVVYQKRLHSNLLYALRPLAGAQANEIAVNLAALIDGIYLREALKTAPPDPDATIKRILHYINTETKGSLS